MGVFLYIFSLYIALIGKECGEFRISGDEDYRKCVTLYKGIWITGYTGIFNITSGAELKNFIYDVGLGEKSSGGMGFIEEVSDSFC